MSRVQLVEIAQGSSVNADPGKRAIYMDTDGTLYTRNDSGVIVSLGGGGASLFGTEFNAAAQRVPTVNTAGGTWANHQTLSPLGLPDGNYLILLSYLWSRNETTSDAQIRFQYNGAPLINRLDVGFEFHAQEPKDSAGGGVGGTNQRYPASLVFFENLLGFSKTLTLDVFTPNGVASTIYDSNIVLFRVS